MTTTIITRDCTPQDNVTRIADWIAKRAHMAASAILGKDTDPQTARQVAAAEAGAIRKRVDDAVRRHCQLLGLSCADTVQCIQVAMLRLQDSNDRCAIEAGRYRADVVFRCRSASLPPRTT